MREGEDELLHWRETSMDPSALPARAADLADAARDVAAPPPQVLARIYASVASGEARAPSRLRGVPIGLRLATLMALLLVSAATAKGAVLLWQRYVAPAAPTAARHAPAWVRVASTQAPKPRVETTPVIEPVEEPPAPAPPGVRESARGTARPRRAFTAERHAPVARAELPEAASPVNEAQLLADALGRLRQAHDPRGALALLDQYAQTYPRGVLVSESRSARLEALLKLDDRQGALALLDESRTFAGRLGAEQMLTRAELRASAGRYADALGDFDRLLSPATTLTAPTGTALERALYGRAVTLGHLGRDDRARADLETYLRRFPAGKHATEVARLLRP